MCKTSIFKIFFLFYTTSHCQSTDRIRIRWKFSGSHIKGLDPQPCLIQLDSPFCHREWEVDYQMRQRSLENILETDSTLSSLAQLISQIANIVIRLDIVIRINRDFFEDISN